MKTIYHHCYSLNFRQTDIPRKRVKEFWEAVREIIDYDKPPADNILSFYIGETYRYKDRISEHKHQPFNKQHETYNYNSRKFCRLLRSFGMKYSHESLIKFPKGSENPVEFEEFWFCKFANLGHPLTNMARTLDKPNIPRLAQANDITEYRNIKSKIEYEIRSRKPIYDHRANAAAIQQSQMTSDVVEAIQRLTAHFTTLSENSTDRIEKAAYKFASKNTTELIMRTVKCPVSYRSIVGHRNMTGFLSQALANKLKLPNKFNDNTNFNDLSEEDQIAYIEWMSEKPNTTPADELKKLTKF